MTLRKRRLKDYLLYVVVDKKTCGDRKIEDVGEAAIRGGASIIQLRDKESCSETVLEEARSLRKLTKRLGVKFIVNDDPRLAKAVNADGVHLGQEDIAIREARAILGKNKIIGASTHHIKEAALAEGGGADYISVGPIFATTTKPYTKPVGLKLITEVKNKIKIPFVAIGGINCANLNSVLASGATRIAVVSSVINAKNVEEAAHNLKKKIDDAARVCKKR